LQYNQFSLNKGELIMSDSYVSTEDKLFHRRIIEAAIRIGLAFLLVLWCFNLVRPFILLVAWGTIISVAVYPMFEKLQSVLGGRHKLAATLMALIAIALLVIPSVMLSESAIETSQTLARQMKEGTLGIPAPPDRVQNWPLVGEKLHKAWSLASDNLSAALS
jgi:predicted PurR-regulated permease PerM